MIGRNLIGSKLGSTSRDTPKMAGNAGKVAVICHRISQSATVHLLQNVPMQPLPRNGRQPSDLSQNKTLKRGCLAVESHPATLFIFE
jgi:hypothetical protein